MHFTRKTPWFAACALAVVFATTSLARAGDPAPVPASAGLQLAESAANAWAADAKLIYVENDDGVSTGGQAGRWGYLYFSKKRAGGRAYSVRDGKIRTATDLPFDFEAPPLPDRWIDSGVALQVADEKKGNDFRIKHQGSVRAMFLVRGILNTDEPDAATWAVVYDSATTSGLWVVVDATTGKVVKTWRG